MSAAESMDVARLNGTERILADVLAEVLNVERLSVDGHFFDELGADSLVMARFCARVRKRGGLPPVSIKDVYRCPTIRSLAAALADALPSSSETSAHSAMEAATPTSTLEYVACGALQLLFYLGYSYLAVFSASRGYEWIVADSDGIEIYLRMVLCSVGGLLVLSSLPILAKWLLIGRWKSGQIRIWSLGYFRFWIVKTLIRSNPCALLFVGTPLYTLYLRALGAKIGPGVIIFSQHVPVCTDLLRIGAGTVIRRESYFLCYRAQAGRIETGAVTLGRDVLVAERTVLDIDTSMGDGAQLGHASALYRGQAVPDGERWHGSPAQRTDVNYLRVAPAPCGALRRIAFSVGTLLSICLLSVPIIQGGVYLLVDSAPSLARAFDASVTNADGVTPWELFLTALALSLPLFFGAAILGLLFVLSVPRALHRLLEPGRVYPLYGFHHWLHRSITRMTNVKFFTHLFGDSSYVVHYLSALGYRLSPVEQTGSNFGTEVKHVNPYLSSVGTGTMVADGLAMLNDEISSTSFCVARTAIGSRCFVGNDVSYPAGGRTGDDCLLATKVMIPLDGRIREGVGLLGSPCFEIPRSVDRDSRFDHLRKGEELRRGLRAKNRYNLRTMGLFLLTRWLSIFLFAALDLAAFELSGAFADLGTAALFALNLPVGVLYFVLVERCISGFRPLSPTYCSVYHPEFWRNERLWKVPAIDHLHALDGTPFKNVIWRLLGVRIGRRVFDDGAHISERTLTT